MLLLTQVQPQITAQVKDEQGYVYEEVKAHQQDEYFTHIVACESIWDKVSEAHQGVKNEKNGDLIHCFQVVIAR